MKTGKVTRLRVNPKDCMRVLSLLENMGVDWRDGRSFSVCVSLALSTALQFLEDLGVIGEVDPFAYSQFMDGFSRNGENNKVKRGHIDRLYARLPVTREGAGAGLVNLPPLNEVKSGAETVAAIMQARATSSEGNNGGKFYEGKVTDEEWDRFVAINEKMNRREAVSEEEEAFYTRVNRLLYG